MRICPSKKLSSQANVPHSVWYQKQVNHEGRVFLVGLVRIWDDDLQLPLNIHLSAFRIPGLHATATLSYATLRLRIQNVNSSSILLRSSRQTVHEKLLYNTCCMAQKAHVQSTSYMYKLQLAEHFSITCIGSAYAWAVCGATAWAVWGATAWAVCGATAWAAVHRCPARNA
eukprot:1150350-Pelagomonas_calceolata.AAC.4